jgi:hypothetical protein
LLEIDCDQLTLIVNFSDSETDKLRFLQHLLHGPEVQRTGISVSAHAVPNVAHAISGFSYVSHV